jgi:predicted dehydrogenase
MKCLRLIIGWGRASAWRTEARKRTLFHQDHPGHPQQHGRLPIWGSQLRASVPSPWIGIHAFDWLNWILGDVFADVMGREGTTARPDSPACGNQTSYLLTMNNGGVATVTGRARSL